jgi:hypothetical protein
MFNILHHAARRASCNGTGNPVMVMFDPATFLLYILHRNLAKYTFYAEIMQQLNMLEASSKM